MLRCTKVLQHDGSWYMCISHTPLASRVKQAFLVVNSIELHLTAFSNCVATCKWRLGAWDTRSLHYWHPAPGWRLLPAMSLHAKPEDLQGKLKRPGEQGACGWGKIWAPTRMPKSDSTQPSFIKGYVTAISAKWVIQPLKESCLLESAHTANKFCLTSDP